mmetsp:Transcript_17566/g.52582  ORF Transcript_17566/g.52582 Transcript_17566/m.52582 type:complete len:226 (-) Transcript_17566:141-818(-)
MHHPERTHSHRPRTSSILRHTFTPITPTTPTHSSRISSRRSPTLVVASLPSPIRPTFLATCIRAPRPTLPTPPIRCISSTQPLCRRPGSPTHRTAHPPPCTPVATHSRWMRSTLWTHSTPPPPTCRPTPPPQPWPPVLRRTLRRSRCDVLSPPPRAATTALLPGLCPATRRRRTSPGHRPPPTAISKSLKRRTLTWRWLVHRAPTRGPPTAACHPPLPTPVLFLT